jgi:hypothetical protein
MDSLYNMMVWIERSALGQGVGNSTWAFAIIQSVHLLALAVIGGAVLIVDLRLIGWGLTRQPVRDLARDAEPWLRWSLIGMIVTGIPLMASLAASKYFVNDAFWLKMLFFILAILFHFTVRRSLVSREDARINPLFAKVVGSVSVLLWSGVGIMGRGIGFY